ncbi:translation initiation factor IF-2 subunit beta [Candidatus Woesearchaeota archaeon CG_4_10_14_0_8_um_filter_47_5]|nr:MAG: translation initiation factor IF-2 subunit beta [Candidatus Woesearchaeota archaeon CG_4_10_14_0_8_um_filter_47_5]
MSGFQRAMEYEEMLKKARNELPEQTKLDVRFELPKVKGHIQGNKTVISNFSQIADVLGRQPEHLLKFVLKELATPGEIDKTRVLFGRKVAAALINQKIQKYAEKYVICRECGKPDTKILRENNIISLKCMACGAKHPL